MKNMTFCADDAILTKKVRIRHYRCTIFQSVSTSNAFKMSSIYLPFRIANSASGKLSRFAGDIKIDK